jgi:glycosyltransferase involved in cell wall biosynthesis
LPNRLLFVVNTDSFFVSHRLPIALAAIAEGYDVHIATGITDKFNLLQAQGLKVHPLRLVRGGVGLVNALQTLVDLMLIIGRIRPDVVHLVTIKPVLLGGLMARWMRVPALVSAVSGLGYVFMADGHNARARLALVKRVYKLALGHINQVVIFQNPDDRDTLIAATGLSSAKAAMIRGSGVDLGQFSVVPEAEGPPVVLLPARMLADKGVFEFVAAAQLLHAKGLAARFVLAGMVDTANPTSISQAQLDAWVAEGAVEHWGYCTDMPQVLASASVVVLPSYREGLPKSLIEAAACGRPVVTTDVPGCRDAITPNVTGVLVPVKNSKSLAAAIELLVENPELRKSMGRAGRELAASSFAIEKIVEQHMAIYKDLQMKAAR